MLIENFKIAIIKLTKIENYTYLLHIKIKEGLKMPSVKDILIEMKDMSELMVDLAYSAVLFNNKAAAEEVLTLENRLNSMNYEIKKQSLVAAR